MRESLDEDISVVFYYDAEKRHIQPYQITWHGRDYRLGKVDFHHRTKQGTTLVHHFSMADINNTTYFKIALDTSSLHWALEEYMDAGDMAVHYGTA